VAPLTQHVCRSSGAAEHISSNRGNHTLRPGQIHRRVLLTRLGSRNYRNPSSHTIFVLTPKPSCVRVHVGCPRLLALHPALGACWPVHSKTIRQIAVFRKIADPLQLLYQFKPSRFCMQPLSELSTPPSSRIDWQHIAYRDGNDKVSRPPLTDSVDQSIIFNTENIKSSFTFPEKLISTRFHCQCLWLHGP